MGIESSVPQAVLGGLLAFRGGASIFYTAALAFIFLATRSSKRPFGTVYDANTLRPLSYAVVSLIRAKGGVTRTEVTDAYGRYRMMAPEGDYVIHVARPGYLERNAEMRAGSGHGHFRNSYRGGTFTVPPSQPLVAFDIALEPSRIGRRTLATRLDASWHVADSWLKALLIVPTFLFMVTVPSVSTATAFMLEVSLFLLSRTDLSAVRPHWGMITDARTGKFVHHARIELIDAETTRQIDGMIADVRGRYNFIVPRNRKVYLRCRRPGYRSFRSDSLHLIGLPWEPFVLVRRPIMLEPNPSASASDRGQVLALIPTLAEVLADREARIGRKPGSP
jgi:hypothetical protein